jgi:uncharacterized protein YxjI
MTPSAHGGAARASGGPLTYHAPGTANERFAHQQYVVRKKVMTIVGAKFHVYDMAGNVVMYSKQKAFKLKEDIRLYTGEDMQTELLRIGARQIIDFSAAYDVVDVQANQKVGAFKRKGWKSLLRDEWIVMDPWDREIGVLVEDSTALALVRRFIDFASLLLPQKFHAEVGGAIVATFQQNYNPFVRKLMVDFTMDPAGTFDRRMGLAAATLLSAIEGRQS